MEFEDVHSLHTARKRRKYCELCEKDLTKSTYYRHKSKFFDHFNGTWIKASELLVPDENSSTEEEDNNSIDELFVDSAAGTRHQYSFDQIAFIWATAFTSAIPQR